MKRRCITILVAIVLATAGVPVFTAQQPASRPKVRTVTAFVRLDPGTYNDQVTRALSMLRAAKAEFTKAGYEVETIRITSQPFPEIIKGLSDEQALAFFREYAQVAQKEGFTPDIGAAMMHDNDDPAQAAVLA